MWSWSCAGYGDWDFWKWSNVPSADARVIPPEQDTCPRLVIGSFEDWRIFFRDDESMGSNDDEEMADANEPVAEAGSQVQPAPVAVSRVQRAAARVRQVQPARMSVGRVQPAPAGVSQVQPARMSVGRVQPAPAGVSQVQPVPAGVSQVQPAPVSVGRAPPAPGSDRLVYPLPGMGNWTEPLDLGPGRLLLPIAPPSASGRNRRYIKAEPEETQKDCSGSSAAGSARIVPVKDEPAAPSGGLA